MLDHAPDNSSKLLVSFSANPEDKESVHEAHAACVGRPVDDRELFQRPTASPKFSFSCSLLCPELEILPETGEKSLWAAAQAELPAGRYRQKENLGSL